MFSVPRCILCRLALVLALFAPAFALMHVAAPAAAQYGYDRWDDHGRWGRGGAVWVEGVYPARTVPGGRVELRGSGFGPGTQVFVDDHAVAIESVRPDLLVFVAPHHEGAGQIVVRDPRAGDQVVGTIVIDVAPTYAQPYPRPPAGPPYYGRPGYPPSYGRGPGYGRGRPGYGAPSIARVEAEAHRRGVRILIEGSGLTPGDTVIVGGVRADVQHVEPGRLIAWAPPGTSGPVTWISARDGRRYDTGAFITPAGYVRTDGDWWRDRGYLPYEGGTPYYPRGRGAYGVPAEIGAIHVQQRRGGEVVLVIQGAGFGPDAQVWLGNVPAPVVSRSDRELIVAVPRGMFGAMPVTIDTRGARITSSTQVVLPR